MPSPAPAEARETLSDVFNLIHSLHDTITQSIDTALTWEQLNSPPVNYTLVRPVVERYSPKSHEKATGSRLSVPSGDHERSSANNTIEVDEVSMGGVIYALMANRFVQNFTMGS